MASFMEKEVLLDYAHLGHLVANMEKTQEIKADLERMRVLHDEIGMLEHKDIDFYKMADKIKEIRAKYEK